MTIDNILLDKLTAQAQASSRLRMNMDLRNSSADSSQRMLNAIEPGSVVEEYYDGAGVLVESFVLGDCHVADAPRNDVLEFAPCNDVPVG